MNYTVNIGLGFLGHLIIFPSYSPLPPRGKLSIYSPKEVHRSSSTHGSATTTTQKKKEGKNRISLSHLLHERIRLRRAARLTLNTTDSVFDFGRSRGLTHTAESIVMQIQGMGIDTTKKTEVPTGPDAPIVPRRPRLPSVRPSKRKSTVVPVEREPVKNIAEMLTEGRTEENEKEEGTGGGERVEVDKVVPQKKPRKRKLITQHIPKPLIVHGKPMTERSLSTSLSYLLVQNRLDKVEQREQEVKKEQSKWLVSDMRRMDELATAARGPISQASSRVQTSKKATSTLASAASSSSLSDGSLTSDGSSHATHDLSYKFAQLGLGEDSMGLLTKAAEAEGKRDSFPHNSPANIYTYIDRCGSL